MNKLVTVLVVALVAVQVNSSVLKSARDLADEVQKQLDELASIVQGQVLIGHSNLENIERAFLTQSNQQLIGAEFSIRQERDTINEQLNVIKNLAKTENIDISPCTSVREPLLNSLPDQYGIQIRDGIGAINKEEGRLVSRARYLVDIAVNKVHSIQFEVNSCNGNLLCLSPIVNDIELEKVRLPQNIKTEVQATVSTLNTLRLSANAVVDDNISQYVASASAILRDITVCVNALLP